MADTESYKKEYSWNLDFAVNLGDVHRKFFEGLEDKQVIGNECPDCGNVFIPPQPHCDECFVETVGWRETDGTGVIESYVVTYSKFRNMPEPPYVSGAIRIGDSDKSLLHFVDGVDYDDAEGLMEKVETGMEVEPVWADDREGSIEDIEYFQPVE
jgi:uncharacterized OB-fold protein